jgi:hypothetical protein
VRAFKALLASTILLPRLGCKKADKNEKETDTYSAVQISGRLEQADMALLHRLSIFYDRAQT